MNVSWSFETVMHEVLQRLSVSGFRFSVSGCKNRVSVSVFGFGFKKVFSESGFGFRVPVSVSGFRLRVQNFFSGIGFRFPVFGFGFKKIFFYESGFSFRVPVSVCNRKPIDAEKTRVLLLQTFFSEECARKNEHGFSFLEAVKVHITTISIFLQTKNAQTRKDSYCGKSNASKSDSAIFFTNVNEAQQFFCLLYTSPSPRDRG